MGVARFLAEKSDGVIFNWCDQREMMTLFKLECAKAEELILQNGYLPSRYQRNQKMISTAQQLQLFQSKVAVVGCGGLGGYILEELTRLGVGQIVAIDPDTFDESNLNRQLFSSLKHLGMAKVDVVVRRISELNPAINVQPFRADFNLDRGAEMLDGADVVVDAVDNIPTRLELATVCDQLNLPLVHGAIAGWFGQVVTVHPGDNSLQKLYGNWTEGQGVEAELGNPSFTPAVIASIQVAEVAKLLLGQGTRLRNQMLSINLLDMQFETIPL